MNEEAKQKIIDYLASKKGKTKHYFNEICKALPDLKMREVKKIVNEMVNEEKLKFWSSGSTSLYMLPDAGALEKEEKGTGS
jgi:hypothetical protein